MGDCHSEEVANSGVPEKRARDLERPVIHFPALSQGRKMGNASWSRIGPAIAGLLPST
jgi:hypothetical protein